jgi:hypothetical protein
MKRWIVAGTLLTATAAYGIGLGAGGFAGIALPLGDMAGSEEGQGNLDLSPKLGGKVLIGVLPALDVEVAFAYHLNHPQKDWDWESSWGIEEPETTVIPITFGANYKLMFGNAGAYFGAGGGYYMISTGGGSEILGETFTYELSINKPGIYFGGGFIYKFGNLALDLSPRYNIIMNCDDYHVDITYGGETHTLNINKDYKDTYVDVLVGLDYYFM